jgi:uncharacterized protein (TIGR00299 family) protein
MFAAAFVNANIISAEELGEALSGLGVGCVHLKTETVRRAGIAGTHITFESPHASDHLHGDEFSRFVESSSLKNCAKTWVLKAWHSILEAEAQVHGTEPGHVHLHEMGHIDTLFDLVCAGVVVEKLGGAVFYLPRLVVGKGYVKMQHGMYPVPAPATVNLLKGIPWSAGEVEFELATPTGAAILRALRPYSEWPEARWDSVGYGAGGKDLPRPNVLRILVGEATVATGTDTITLLMADMDDMSPQHFPYVQERLLEAGALDVCGESIMMKKGRPGLRIQVMSPPQLADMLAEILFRETTTLGVRLLPIQRRVLDREIREVATPYGAVKVKVGLLGGQIVNVAPEYEDCQRLARTEHVPLKAVSQAAILAAKASMKEA